MTEGENTLTSESIVKELKIVWDLLPSSDLNKSYEVKYPQYLLDALKNQPPFKDALVNNITP